MAKVHALIEKIFLNETFMKLLQNDDIVTTRAFDVKLNYHKHCPINSDRNTVIIVMSSTIPTSGYSALEIWQVLLRTLTFIFI